MKVRIEWLDGRVEVISEKAWKVLEAKGDEWLADNVNSAEKVEE